VPTSDPSEYGLYRDTLVYVRELLRPLGIGLAAFASAVLLGVGVPLGWVWLASRVQSSPGQGTSYLAALLALGGPLATYAGVLMVLLRVAPRHPAARPEHLPWNRSRGDEKHVRPTTTLEQVVILATLVVAVAAEVYFIFFAHQQPWGQ